MTLESPQASSRLSASPTDKTSRVDDAYARLKSQILSNAMPPGFQAPEPEIAERLGMSRTPVREALIRLKEEAEFLGLDSVINVRFTTSMVQQGMAEMLAFGTAVKLA